MTPNILTSGETRHLYTTQNHQTITNNVRSISLVGLWIVNRMPATYWLGLGSNPAAWVQISEAVTMMRLVFILTPFGQFSIWHHIAC